MKDNCTYFENIFIDYINGTLNKEDNAFCVNHLKTCEKCKNNEDLKDLQFTWKQMDKWSDIQPSKNFMAKLQHEIVLLEEKQRIFWFKLDSLMAIFRVPITALFILIFSFSNSLPYANAQKTTFQENSLKVETQLKDYGKKSISEVLKDFKNVMNTKRRI